MILYDSFGDELLNYDGNLCEALEEIAKNMPTTSKPLRFINLSGMDISNTNLENMAFLGTDLRGTNLSGCNLDNAYFNDCHVDENTNFIGAKIRGEILKQNPIYINTGTRWDVIILDEKIIMGCQCHHLRTWENITNEILSKLDEDCIVEFRKRQTDVFKIARVHQKEFLDSLE